MILVSQAKRIVHALRAIDLNHCSASAGTRFIIASRDVGVSCYQQGENIMSLPRFLIARRNFLITSLMAGGAMGLLPVTAARAAGGNWTNKLKIVGDQVRWPKGKLFL